MERLFEIIMMRSMSDALNNIFIEKVRKEKSEPHGFNDSYPTSKVPYEKRSIHLFFLSSPENLIHFPHP